MTTKTEHEEPTPTCPDCGFVLGTEMSNNYGDRNYCWSNVDATGEELMLCKVRHWKARAHSAESELAAERARAMRSRGDVDAALEALLLTRWHPDGNMAVWAKTPDGINHAEVQRAIDALRSSQQAAPVEPNPVLFAEEQTCPHCGAPNRKWPAADPAGPEQGELERLMELMAREHAVAIRSQAEVSAHASALQAKDAELAELQGRLEHELKVSETYLATIHALGDERDNFIAQLEASQSALVAAEGERQKQDGHLVEAADLLRDLMTRDRNQVMAICYNTGDWWRRDRDRAAPVAEDKGQAVELPLVPGCRSNGCIYPGGHLGKCFEPGDVLPAAAPVAEEPKSVVTQSATTAEPDLAHALANPPGPRHGVDSVRTRCVCGSFDCDRCEWYNGFSKVAYADSREPSPAQADSPGKADWFHAVNDLLRRAEAESHNISATYALNAVLGLAEALRRVEKGGSNERG